MGSIRTVRCSRCGVMLAVPPFVHNVCCTRCRHTTYVGRDPVNDYANFANNPGNPINSIGMQQHFGHPNPWVYNVPASNYPRVFGKKRALLIRITYSASQKALKGPINDVNCVAYLLTHKFGFTRECMLILTDKEHDSSKIPTKRNMLAAMRWLVSGCVAGDSLVFYFSGHAAQVPDETDDEPDGMDEALCPVDYEKNGLILDDTINEIIVRPLPYNVKLHAIFDTCHSGTSLDLPFLCRISRRGSWQWDDHRPLSGENKGTSGGLAILISGCDDHQNSEETPNSLSDFDSSNSTGAMTYSFIEAVESEPAITYGRLLTAMRAAVDNYAKGRQFSSGPIASLLRRANFFRSKQEPQLSSSELFDIYRKPFLL